MFRRIVDGSHGTFRAPAATCTLSADNDYEAVQAWLGLHESVATQRAYRKEAERLILWAVLERGRALSSLTTEDAIAYRAFLRHPTPVRRWVGPARPRSAGDWRPFTGGLAPRSVAYALSVVGAMFRWLIQQRYTLANPFAGIKVRGASRSESTAVTRVFSEGEWSLIQAVAEGLEWGHAWEAPAAQRLRFVLDFAYATGLRISALVEIRQVAGPLSTPPEFGANRLRRLERIAPTGGLDGRSLHAILRPDSRWRNWKIALPCATLGAHSARKASEV